ncbi:MAG: glycosyltransferase family 4 protein [bacterium]
MSLNLEFPDDSKTESLKVLFITHNYIRFKGDFAGVFLHLLARKLREQGLEVIVVAPHDASFADSEVIDGIRVFRFRYAPEHKETFAYRGDMHRQLLRNPLRIFRLFRFLNAGYKLAREIIEKEEIKVVSVHWVVPNGVIGYRLKRRFKDRIRLVLSSHGTDVRLLTQYKLLLRLFRPVIRSSRRWTVVSSFLKEKISARDFEAAGKVQVVPLPNDESLFYPDDRIRREPSLVVAVSRLTVQKRLPILFQAIKLASREIPGLKLEVYGTGPEKFRLERMITDIGLEGRVSLVEPLPQRELRRVYNRATVVVLNSVGEGFGLALTEAMLCRTPVIGARSGGILDIIEDRKTGLLVPPDNPERLAEAIRLLIKDSELRTRLAEEGYNFALRRFSSAAAARQYAEIFKSA